MTLKGLILGFILVLPGMSGGTVLIILGIYEQLVRDLAKIKLKPYIPLGIGVLAGIYLGSVAFTSFFQYYRDETAVFLLGCLLATLKPILGSSPRPNAWGILSLGFGIAMGLFMVDGAIGDMSVEMSVNWGTLIIGGALSSAAMLIPGVPGNVILIFLGIYDSMLYYVSQLAILKLVVFGISSLLGILLLANALNLLFTKHRMIISYLIGGLIIGSSKALLPSHFEMPLPILFFVGFALVWLLSGKEY